MLRLTGGDGMEHDQRADCKLLLDQYGSRVEKLETCSLDLQKKNERLDVKLDQVIKNMSDLIKAIWGMVTLILATLGGFVIWYIQYIAK
jgi:hypothetical protein